MKFLAQLQNPPREFTAIPFWFLNGELTDEELRRQLADFAAHGIYGVVLHPRMGLSPDITYLGERYFAHIRTAVEAAAALDMKIVLYDEGMYPSGSASGLVVKDHPELASEGITLTQTVLPGDELLAQAESGMLVVRKSGGTMRGLHWGEDDGEKNAPKTADILNPAAVSRFIELTHEAYYRELKEYFGAAIIGFFTDEPSILGRNVSGMFPWTHGFAEIFRRAGGNAANLAALFDGRENDDTRLYHKLLLQREGEVYYGTLSRWCEAHGIGLMGHPHQSDDIEVEKYFAVPGQDLVLRWLAPEKDGLAGIDSTMAKCSADAARLMHRRRNANECFGACNKDDKNHVRAVETIKLQSVHDPKTGRMRMEEIEGSEQILDADLVLIAAGFLGAQAYVTDAFGVETTPRTNVSTKIGHYSTSVEKVFTAGDMHRGQSLVVWAIREGREAAKEVDQYLMGYTNLN